MSQHQSRILATTQTPVQIANDKNRQKVFFAAVLGVLSQVYFACKEKGVVGVKEVTAFLQPQIQAIQEHFHLHQAQHGKHTKNH